MMKRLGIFGGSFDPVHLGHLLLAESAREELELEKIVFVPAGQSPLKKNLPYTCAEDRWRMLRLAIEDNPFFFASRVELDREPPSYTIETVDHFRRIYPETDLWLIIGEDNLGDLPRWRECNRLLSLIKIGVGARPGYHQKAIPKELLDFTERIKFFSHPEVEISSRVIREKIRRGGSIRYLLPPAVQNYIGRHNLYKNLG